MRTQPPLAMLIAVIFFGCSMHAVLAAATATRAWVSAVGLDQPACGSRSSPCRTPQYAHDNIVASGGEIDFLDPGGYGSITITKAINLVNDGVGTTGMLAPANGIAIQVNAGPTDAVLLRGLSIEGSGVGWGGILFKSGRFLIVDNCVVQNFVKDPSGFAGDGITIQPATTVGVVITNTIVSNNSSMGINYLPRDGGVMYGTFDHVKAVGNLYGIGFKTAGLDATTGTATTISNSVVANNATAGIWAIGGAINIQVAIDNVNVSNNGNGIEAHPAVKVLLSRSVVTGNQIGILNSTSGTFYTYQDNRVFLNGVEDLSAQLNTTPTFQ